VSHSFNMSYRSKLLSTTRAVAPDPFYGRLSEPLLEKKRDGDVGDEQKENDDPWSSIGVIVGALVLGAVG
jgi:hypothetical protein